VLALHGDHRKHVGAVHGIQLDLMRDLLQSGMPSKSYDSIALKQIAKCVTTNMMFWSTSPAGLDRTCSLQEL
jgi:hypothetical protein